MSTPPSEPSSFASSLSSARRSSSAFGCRYTIASRAPTATAAIIVPRRTPSGECLMSVRESGLSGSASYAFAMTSGARPVAFAASRTAAIFFASG
ncbi:MAG: hypothetical protein E6J52_12995 [Chloroflexi bacterium]|nr:MAG: hypothetical protein E6J52_12995 [Chloroflexota bacterium]